MIHITAHLLFALGLLWWFAFELKKPFNPKKNFGWMIANLSFVVIALGLANVDNGRLGNVLLHSIGGGMATACSFEYFKRNLDIKLNWRVDIIALFFLVSTFGVLNEIFEFAADVAGFGMFSIDRFDTWRDFVANTLGALLVWLIVQFIYYIKKPR